jgi:hypothetical protein
MSTQRQKPIGFATEGFRLALPAERNCEIRVERFEPHCYPLTASFTLRSKLLARLYNVA